MLEFQLPDDRPLLREGITCKLEGESIPIQPEDFVSDFCFCEFVCERPLIAFGGVTERERDRYTLYYQNRDEEEGTLRFFGEYNGIEFELEDGVHGQSIDHGFIVDFHLILTNVGNGKYSFRINILEFGIEKVRNFKYFEVVAFNDILADGTVKIESIQNGRIESQFIYNEVPFSIRMYGKLHDRQEIFESIQNDTNNRRVEEIHTRTHFKYSLEIDCNSVSEHRFVNDLLINYSITDQILISDYNLARNQYVYNKLPVIRVNESANIENSKESQYAKYTIAVEDSIQNNIKRPFSS